MNIELWQRIDSFIVAGQLEDARKELENDLKLKETERFKSLIDNEFSNDPLGATTEFGKNSTLRFSSHP